MSDNESEILIGVPPHRLGQGLVGLYAPSDLRKMSQTAFGFHPRILKVLRSRVHTAAFVHPLFSLNRRCPVMARNVFASSVVELSALLRSYTPRLSQCLMILALDCVFVIKSAGLRFLSMHTRIVQLDSLLNPQECHDVSHVFQPSYPHLFPKLRAALKSECTLKLQIAVPVSTI